MPPVTGSSAVALVRATRDAWAWEYLHLAIDDLTPGLLRDQKRASCLRLLFNARFFHSFGVKVDAS